MFEALPVVPPKIFALSLNYITLKLGFIHLLVTDAVKHCLIFLSIAYPVGPSYTIILHFYRIAMSWICKWWLKIDHVQIDIKYSYVQKFKRQMSNTRPN